MSSEDLSLACENLRGELRRLDTVLKMSMAEQRRINAELAGANQRHAALAKEMQGRMDRLNTRLATYTGTVVAMWLIFQVAARALWP